MASGIVGVGDVVAVGLVDDDQDVLGDGVDESGEGVAADHRSRRVVGIADVGDLRPWSDPVGQPRQVVRAVDERNGRRRRAHLDRVEVVGDERRPAHDGLVARVEVGGREAPHDPVGPVPDRDHRAVDSVPRRQPFGQVVAELRIAVQLGRLAGDRLERRRERPERALVRGQLHDPVEAQLAAHRGGRLPRLVRLQIGDGGTGAQRVTRVPTRCPPARSACFRWLPCWFPVS